MAARGSRAAGRKEIHDRYSQCRWRWRPSRAKFGFFEGLRELGWVEGTMNVLELEHTSGAKALPRQDLPDEVYR